MYASQWFALLLDNSISTSLFVSLIEVKGTILHNGLDRLGKELSFVLMHLKYLNNDITTEYLVSHSQARSISCRHY